MCSRVSESDAKGRLVNTSPAQVAARARAARRKRLQQRQTVIFGSIITVLLGAAVFAGGVWAEIIPSPLQVELKTPEPQVAPVVTQPCPPEGAMPVPFDDISVKVLNSTDTSGLGARTAEEMGSFGVQIDTIANASDLYLGSAKILVGVEYLDYGYTVADLIPDAQVSIDTRTEAIVDVVLGAGFIGVKGEDELALDPEQPIPAPSGCIVVDSGTGGEDVDEDTSEDGDE